MKSVANFLIDKMLKRKRATRAFKREMQPLDQSWF